MILILSSIQSRNFRMMDPVEVRNKMLLTDKLLKSMNRIKSPSIESIYGRDFETEELHIDRNVRSPMSVGRNIELENIINRDVKNHKAYRRISGQFLDNLYLHQLAVSHDESSFNNEHFKKFLKKFRKNISSNPNIQTAYKTSGISLDLKFK